MEHTETGKKDLEAKLDCWKNKVLATYELGGPANTYRMIQDVDSVIAKAFDHDPVITDTH